jgi:hypothetical protein
VDLCPRLRFAIHECNAGWVSAWLDRADESYQTVVHMADRLLQPPSQYVRERDVFFFGMSAAENPHHVRSLWQRVTVATDFPHPGSSIDAGAQWCSHLSELGAKERDGLLYANALRLI